LGGSIEGVERAFSEWRRDSHRGRIPDRLWGQAADLVRNGGLSVTRVSRRLRLDYDALKGRIASTGLRRDCAEGPFRTGTHGATFAELSVPAEASRTRSGHELVRIRVEGHVSGAAIEIVSSSAVAGDILRVVGSLLR